MTASSLARRIFWSVESLLLAGSLALVVVVYEPAEWHSPVLLGMLLALALIGERLEVFIRGQQLSASFVALVLAMSLLGPGPAVLIGLAAKTLRSATARLSPAFWLTNLSTYAVFPLVGGLMVRGLIGGVHDPANRHLTQGITFALVVFAVFTVTNTLNFAQIALDNWIVEDQQLGRQVRDHFVPLMPGQFALGALSAVLATAYTNLGLSTLFGAILVLLLFQYLMIALLRSEDRADQLEERSIHLASLQLGVLTMLVETLALRDRTTARHAAAVARYARELAAEVGCNEAEEEIVHTAGLLHDIGKFALPDHILHAQVLSDDDWAVIRRHPQDGAALVGRLDGYAPVAEAILYHHEHVDGSGYPAGLIDKEIPLASRIVAVCSTYDTLTAHETYRSPMTPQDAMTELRRVAGRQLDAELVESFIAMLGRKGPVALAHGDEADFEAELAFGRRVRSIAQPTRD